MKAGTPQFSAVHPVPWNGRYARVEGEGSVFHLRYFGGQLWPVVLWETDAGLATCRAVDSPTARALANAVADAKRRQDGDGGGSFSINEFGKVIVPASDGGGRRLLAGRLDGRLLFENPFDPNEPIDLSDSAGLACGVPWCLPYVGIPFQLHCGSLLYVYQEDDDGGRSIYPPHQYNDLIRAIRNIRPYGAVRILVTLGGLVLTKVPRSTGSFSAARWQPVFVRAINPNLWFEEE